MVVKPQHVLCVRQIQSTLFCLQSQVYLNDNLKVVILTQSGINWLFYLGIYHFT